MNLVIIQNNIKISKYGKVKGETDGYIRKFKGTRHKRIINKRY